MNGTLLLAGSLRLERHTLLTQSRIRSFIETLEIIKVKGFSKESFLEMSALKMAYSSSDVLFYFILYF